MTGDDRITWRTVRVAGRTTRYGVAGFGRPVLFLHGWGLSGRTYSEALSELVAAGMRVYAPSLPGFGGTAPLPVDDVTIGGYADWVGELLRAIGIGAPVVVIGHSFGGGVAIRLAHDHPDLVSQLVMVNAIGGSAWLDGRGSVRPMRERPLWDWALQARTEVRLDRRLVRTMPRILRDMAPSVMRNSGMMWRVATLARTADMAAELTELRRRRLAVTIAWSEQDTVIPQSAFAALREALGGPVCATVPGGTVG